MANCINCGGELFETSKFCPHCGTPVLEVSNFAGNSKVKEYDNNDPINYSEDGLPEVNTAELTPEEQAAVLEMAAEKVLEDIPFIKKLDDISAKHEISKSEEPVKPQEIHKENAEKEAPKHYEDASKPKEDIRPENEDISEKPAGKSKGGIIAVIAILAACAIGGGLFYFSRTSEPANVTAPDITTLEETVPESETISEVMETEALSEITTVSETILSTETPSDTVISAEETTADTELSETSVPENAAAEEGHTADELAQGIVIEPEHSLAMGNNISAEIKLSEQGISHDILSSGVLFLVEYSSDASTPANYTPAAMVMTINDTPIEVTATSCSEKMVIFEFDVMTSAAEAAGYSSADIDSVAIKSTGVPIDVFRITVLQG